MSASLGAAGASIAMSASLSAAGASNATSTDTGAAGASNAGGAGPDTAGACFSPLRPELQPAPLAPASQGCECETYQAGPDGIGRVYCLSGHAVYCPNHLHRWIVGFDGPCSPNGGPTPLDVCTERLGGNPVARGTECPSGFAVDYNFASTPDADAGTPSDAVVDCCYPIRVTAQNCTQAGFEVLEGGNPRDVLQTSCSNGRALRGFVGASGTRVCCERP